MSTNQAEHPAQVRVLLVDDHPILRGGLKALIDVERDMSVVGEVADGLAAIRAAASLAPHVIVMDVAMPKLGGADATAQIKATHPAVKVLALSAHDERGYVQMLLDAGASGYVLKRSAAADVVRAIRAVAAGGIYLDPAVAGHVIGGRAGKSNLPTAAQLSERETEVLRMIAAGYGVKETAAALAISPRTLETYRSRAMEKLGLRTRAEIVSYALQRGWLGSG